MCERFLLGPHDGGRFAGFGPLEGLMGLLLVGLIAAGLVALIVNLARTNRTQSVTSYGVQAQRDPALEAVRMRYAQGEITREEYTAVAADLDGRPPPAATS
jgi:uncharacterized membrane protein